MKIIKSYRKTISLQIKNGEIIIKAPFFVFKKTIEKFIEKNKDWIEKNLEKSKKLEKQKKENENFLYLFWKKQEKIKIKEDKIIFLKKEAKKYIPERVEILAKKFGFEFNIIKITSAKTRWGSCTSKKNLNFSYRLISSPIEVIDYVIIHELSHLKHMNHSRNFWIEVGKMMPDYKDKEKWLKENGGMIS